MKTLFGMVILVSMASSVMAAPKISVAPPLTPTSVSDFVLDKSKLRGKEVMVHGYSRLHQRNVL